MLLVSVLWIASWTNRRTQKALSNRSAAAQLRRSASHLYKIARTAKIYSLHDAIVRVLLQETARVLKRAIKLDPEHVATHEALRNCGEMRAAFDAAVHESNTDQQVMYPASELLLLEAQMHLTEISRLLGSLEKRGLVSSELRHAITTTLRYAQRSLELRLNLRQVTLKLRAEHSTDVDPQSLNNYVQTHYVY